jgi:hypothetical protein
MTDRAAQSCGSGPALGRQFPLPGKRRSAIAPASSRSEKTEAMAEGTAAHAPPYLRRPAAGFFFDSALLVACGFALRPRRAPSWHASPADRGTYHNNARWLLPLRGFVGEAEFVWDPLDGAVGIFDALGGVGVLFALLGGDVGGGAAGVGGADGRRRHGAGLF